MFKPLRLPPNTFFLSDPHLRHKKDFVWRKRGFDSSEEHDRGVLDSINFAVKPEDNLVLLGDFSLNSSVEDTKNLFRQITCRNIYMIWGNHESYTSKIYQEAILSVFQDEDKMEVYPMRYENVTFLGHYAEFLIDKNIYACFHYPISVWNNAGHGTRHLCGHSHRAFNETLPDAACGAKLDVGWDVFQRPILVEEIETIMRLKPFVKKDHHE